ncbi:MAG: ABC transporter ATP-binding protein [Actinomycetota bacterium]
MRTSVERWAPVLEVQALTAGYGAALAIRDVSLRVQPGEIVAILGANGAGKSTTLKAVYGVIRPRHGRVTVDGADMTGAGPRRMTVSGCALVPEGRGLFPALSVEEHLLVGEGNGRQADHASGRELVFEYFPKLAERRRQPAGTLSGGEQQMLALGRALVARPRLLLVDELSTGLAPIVIDELYGRLIEAVRDHGTSLLVVEQHVTTALNVAGRAYVLETGRVVLDGTAAELASDDLVRSSYLGMHSSGSPRPSANSQVSAGGTGTGPRSRLSESRRSGRAGRRDYGLPAGLAGRHRRSSGHPQSGDDVRRRRRQP